MGALNVILLVVFVLACVLIIFLVLLQNEEGDSIGGLFAGGSNSAFGARSGNILTKSTYVLVTIFFASSFILAILNKTASAPTEGMQKEGQELQKENATPWYDEKKEGSEGEKLELQSEGEGLNERRIMETEGTPQSLESDSESVLSPEEIEKLNSLSTQPEESGEGRKIKNESETVQDLRELNRNPNSLRDLSESGSLKKDKNEMSQEGVMKRSSSSGR